MWPRCLCVASRDIKTIESVRLCTEDQDGRRGDASLGRRNRVALKPLLSGSPYIPVTAAHLDSPTPVWLLVNVKPM